jgi:hypothetical protein
MIKSFGIYLLFIGLFCTSVQGQSKNDSLASYFGTYYASPTYISYCKSSPYCTNYCCFSRVDVMYHNDTTAQFWFTFDPSTLSRCSNFTIEWNLYIPYITNYNDLYYNTVYYNVSTYIMIYRNAADINFMSIVMGPEGCTQRLNDNDSGCDVPQFSNLSRGLLILCSGTIAVLVFVLVVIGIVTCRSPSVKDPEKNPLIEK